MEFIAEFFMELFVEFFTEFVPDWFEGKHGKLKKRLLKITACIYSIITISLIFVGLSIIIEGREEFKKVGFQGDFKTSLILIIIGALMFVIQLVLYIVLYAVRRRRVKIIQE